VWTERTFGHSPVRDPERYWRNSPIRYSDAIHTPLLLLHGDADHVPLAQSEEMFNALYRQGKRAMLVRYDGEEHILMSPANAVDYWARILAWFDEFGDISRDESGNLRFEAGLVQSRHGSPALKPESFSPRLQ
jgi:dipeptidyl aminopeptidase/acylaminoacyl peptidase